MTPNHLIITYRVTSRNINLENLTKKIAAKATLNRKNSNQTVKLPEKPDKERKPSYFNLFFILPHRLDIFKISINSSDLI